MSSVNQLKSTGKSEILLAARRSGNGKKKTGQKKSRAVEKGQKANVSDRLSEKQTFSRYFNERCGCER
jgi:hypothetical protein